MVGQHMRRDIHIENRIYWIKILELLQQNWAIIEPSPRGPSGACEVFFIDDNSCVFDKLRFASSREAEAGLARNGFRRYEPDPQMLQHIPPPSPPFYESEDCQTFVYSSGRYWRNE